MSVWMSYILALTSINQNVGKQREDRTCCWRENNNESINITKKIAIGFIFDNDSIVITNPKCQRDHYRFGLTEMDVTKLRKSLMNGSRRKATSGDFPLAFKAIISGKAFRERSMNIFLGKINSAVLLSVKIGRKAYIKSGGK